MGLSKQKMSFAEYIALEREADYKSEFFDGEIFAMAGGTLEHSYLGTTIAFELNLRMRKSPCKVFNSDLRVKVASTGLVTYPDCLVVCGPTHHDPEDPDTITNPKILVEVLSESTEKYDRSVKLRHYVTIPSLTDFLLISQGVIQVEHYHRKDDGSWAFRLLGPGQSLELLDFEIPVDDIYRGIEDLRTPTPP